MRMRRQRDMARNPLYYLPGMRHRRPLDAGRVRAVGSRAVVAGAAVALLIFAAIAAAIPARAAARIDPVLALRQ
jgi:hypothetical protein